VSVAAATDGLTPALVADLHATLDASLASVLNVAIPQQKLQGLKAGPAARVAKGPKGSKSVRPDPLDSLIGKAEARHDEKEGKGS
jgi:hypothetical protein